MHTHAHLAAFLLLLAGGTAIGAQPQDDSAGETAESQPADLPSLDELLGIEGEDSPSTDPNRDALDEVLSPQAAGEAFSQAVGLMDRVAARIGEQGDLSIATQRLQEDILRKLDQVIASAQSNDQGGGGGSSGSQSSGSSQQQPDQQQSGGQAQGGQEGSSPGDSMPAGTSQAQPGDEVAPDGVGWGALPARIRDALSQGISDEYSQLYRAVTEQYYKALAEEED